MNNNYEKGTKRKNTALGILFILIAGTCWGGIGIFVRRFNTYGLASMDIVALRAVFTTVFMAIFSTVPFQPEWTAATTRRTGSYSSTGTQSAVLTPMATPGSLQMNASYPSRSALVRSGLSITAILSPCT